MTRATLKGSILFLATLAATGLVAAQDLLQQRRPAAPLISEQLQGDLLPIEEAFRLQLDSSGSNGLQLHWQIAPGHYLYRKSLQVLLPNGSALEGLQPPPATAIEDEYFGAVDVYYDVLQLPLPRAVLAAGDSAAASVNIEVHFQGCAEDRYCYPPHRQIISIPLPRDVSP